MSELYNNDQGDDDEIGRVSSRTMAVELEFGCVMFSCLFSVYFRGRARRHALVSGAYRPSISADGDRRRIKLGSDPERILEFRRANVFYPLLSTVIRLNVSLH